MKHTLLNCSFLSLLGLPLLAAGPLAAQTLTNNGGTLFVNNGGTLTVNGGYQQSSGALLRNDGTARVAGDVTTATGSTLNLSTGTLDVTGNISSATVSGSTGALRLSGSSTQTVGLNASTLPNLTVDKAGGAASLTEALQIRRMLTVAGAGTLNLNGQTLTLLSDASGTALVVNSGTGTVTGATATVQRYIDNSLNPGLGYRHLAAPVAGSTVNDLATAGFAPEVNPAYNASATPGTTMPFPTVFGYDQSRVGTVASNYAPFDQGWVSPATLGDALTVGQGYTVSLAGGLTPDFTGTLTTGSHTLALSRGSNAESGWALVGNPYPSPLDWSLVAPADRTGLDAAIYVFESNGQYTGTYRASVNGVGGNANSGSSLVGTAQGFFVRVSSGQTSGSLTFRDAQRLTSYATQVPVRRGTADPRPLVQLRLQGGSAPADDLFVYAEAGATAGTDREFDAVKRANSTGLNLAALAATGEELAIQGLPLLTAATVVPLTVEVPTTGAYAFTAPALNNLPATTRVELVDNLTGARQDLRTLPTAGYAFTATATRLPGRFSLNLTPAGVLAATPAALAAQVQAYPNPVHGQLTLVRPVGAATTAELVNSLGQRVRRFALPTAETVLDVRELPAGVYVLRLTLYGQPVTKRVVVE